MTPDDHVGDEPAVSPQEQVMLDGARDVLVEHLDARWVEISDRVLATALTATRRSSPVRAQAPGGPVQVSEQVLVAYLRAAVDAADPDGVLAEARIDVEGVDAYAGVTILLVTRYGQPIIPIADRVRAAAYDSLTELLGPVVPAVDVRTMHVHVSDVTTGDPHSTAPDEEWSASGAAGSGR